MNAFASDEYTTVTTIFANAYSRGVTVERQQLTALDRHVGTNRCVLPWAFLYKDTLQPGELQAALAATLDVFPTLGGRVQPLKAKSWLASLRKAPDWVLLCNNAGVPFSIHTSSTTLQELLDSGAMSSRRGFTFPDAQAALPGFMERLDPVDVLAGNAPVLVVRLTQLAGGGSILAVTASHIVLDGRSYVLFMQLWAKHYNALTSTAAAATADPVPVPVQGQQEHLADVAVVPAPSPTATSSSSSRSNDNKQIMIALTVAAAAGHAKDITSVAAAAAAAAAASEHPTPLAAAAASHSPTASNQRPQSRDFPYTPDPLFATRVLPPGWSAALKGIRAALRQVRSEERHIKGMLQLQQAQFNKSSGSSRTSKASGSNKPAAAAVKPFFTAKEKTVDTRILSTELLHIPKAALHKLKAAASLYCREGQYISTNDAVSSLAWLLMCQLRGRPLPGQARPPELQDTCLGLALDLRTTAQAASSSNTQPHVAAAKSGALPEQGNGRQHSAGGNVPMDYFGSAAWSIHVRSCTETGAAAEEPGQQLPLAWHPNLTPKELHMMTCEDEQVLLRSLAAGAVRIRGALQAMRRTRGFAGKMLQQVEDGVNAPVSSQLAMTASLVHRLDAFVTSWQFDIYDVAFGGRGSSQGPLMFQGLVHPVPPYHAVVLPAPNLAENGLQNEVKTDAAATAAAKIRGGVLCWITVPSCLVHSMVSSHVLKVLAPSAQWVSLGTGPAAV